MFKKINTIFFVLATETRCALRLKEMRLAEKIQILLLAKHYIVL